MRNDVDVMRSTGPVSTRVDSKYLMVIMDKLELSLTYRSYPVGKRFSITANNQLDCFILRKGAISLYRQPDDILLELLEGPTLRGIIPVHEASKSQYVLRVIDTAEIAILDKQKFYTLLTEHNLWETYAMHLQLVTSMAAEILFKLVSRSAFELVRSQLYELMSKPESMRDSITAENYIRGKTRLSRSAIMNTLSVLKTGGYVSIVNGHLKEIKHIPEHF